MDPLPQVGTVHRATPRGVPSLHASVSVDRVYNADHTAHRRAANARGARRGSRRMISDLGGMPDLYFHLTRRARRRGFDWAGLLLAVLEQARRADGAVGAGGGGGYGGGPGPDLGPVSAEDVEDVTLWVNEVAAMASGEALRRIPRAFTSAGVSDAAGGDLGAARSSPNALLLSIDGVTDLPCESGAGESGKKDNKKDGKKDDKNALEVQFARGETSPQHECRAQFRSALRGDFERTIEPVLIGPLLGASPLGAGGPEAATWLRALCHRAMADDGLLSRAVASIRSAMQDTMPPLLPRGGFGDEARAARSDAAARAAERASRVGLRTLVQRSSAARPLLAGADGQLRANTAHAAGWPQRVPPGTRRAVRWALGAYSGAAGRPFTAVELAAQRAVWAPGRRGAERGNAESRVNGSAREVVRWLVARQLLDVVAGADPDETHEAEGLF